jgi:hypothetical protein
MNKRLLLKLVHVWWAGFKVLCRWSAFGIVLTILSIPAMALADLVHSNTGYIVGMIFVLLLVPIVFYLTSRYLLLLGDDSQEVVRDGENAVEAGSNRTLKKKIVVSTLVAFLAGWAIGPPDFASQFVLGLGTMLLCAVPLLILARTVWVKSSSGFMHTLVCILVCAVSVLSVHWVVLGGHLVLFPSSGVSSSGSFKLGNLWIGYSSDDVRESVICSVDSPKTCTYGGSDNSRELTFSDGSSVKFRVIRDETVWIDQQHKVTFLGPLLEQEDVALLRNWRQREIPELSSPKELMMVVDELKAENAASTNQPEAAPE